MTEQEQIQLMKKIAAKLFKRMRRVMEDEFRSHELQVSDFHNIALSAMASVNANLVMWVKHMTELKTGQYFDPTNMTNGFIHGIIQSIQLIESTQAKQKEQMQ